MAVKVPGRSPTAASAPTTVTVAWSNVTDKPATFPPSTHTHAYADITGKPATFAPSAHTHLWADITDKPATYPPAAHTHAWVDITGKPTVFPPSAHTHSYNDLTDKPIIPAATPLGSAPGAALGTASAGSSANAAREDHVHPLPSGRLQLIGTVTVTETTLISLALGMKRMALTLTGVTTADSLVFVPTGVPTAGCEAVNVYASGTNQVTVAYFVPALGVGATYSIPIRVYRIT